MENDDTHPRTLILGDRPCLRKGNCDPEQVPDKNDNLAKPCSDHIMTFPNRAKLCLKMRLNILEMCLFLKTSIFLVLVGGVEKANAQLVVLSHHKTQIELPLAPTQQLEFHESGSIYAERGVAGKRLRFLQVTPRATAGEVTAVLEKGNLKINLVNEPKLLVLTGNHDVLTYSFDAMRQPLSEELTANNWVLDSQSLTVRVPDSSPFDSMAIAEELDGARMPLLELEALAMRQHIQGAPLSSIETELAFVSARNSIHNGLSDARYAPTRDYLSAKLASLEAELKTSNDPEKLTQNLSEFLKLIDRASKVKSFDVASTTSSVQVELFAVLDTEPRKVEHTNGRITAVSPGKYRLVASKDSYKRARRELDLFFDNPTVIRCSMSKLDSDEPSKCQIEEYSP